MHDIQMTAQEMLDKSFLPQTALRFYAYIYSLVGTPCMQNIQYFQAIKCVHFNQLKPTSTEFKNDIIYEFYNSVPLFMFEKIYTQFKISFDQQKAVFLKQTQLN